MAVDRRREGRPHPLCIIVSPSVALLTSMREMKSHVVSHTDRDLSHGIGLNVMVPPTNALSLTRTSVVQRTCIFQIWTYLVLYQRHSEVRDHLEIRRSLVINLMRD
jgi:hypothetical protein